MSSEQSSTFTEATIGNAAPPLSGREREIALQAIAARATGTPVEAAYQILAGIEALDVGAEGPWWFCGPKGMVSRRLRTELPGTRPRWSACLPEPVTSSVLSISPSSGLRLLGPDAPLKILMDWLGYQIIQPLENVLHISRFELESHQLRAKQIQQLVIFQQANLFKRQ